MHVRQHREQVEGVALGEGLLLGSTRGVRWRVAERAEDPAQQVGEAPVLRGVARSSLSSSTPRAGIGSGPAKRYRCGIEAPPSSLAFCVSAGCRCAGKVTDRGSRCPRPSSVAHRSRPSSRCRLALEQFGRLRAQSVRGTDGCHRVASVDHLCEVFPPGGADAHAVQGGAHEGLSKRERFTSLGRLY